MKLYNTLTKQVEDLEPQNPDAVTIYTCGPTVYDYPHIGNWFTFIRYDLLVRTLKASGLQTKWVLNITDVGHLVSDADEGEDKLEKGARREGKTAWEVAEFYTDYFLKGLERLNITKPDELPRATAHIDGQIDFIKQLEAKGFTYRISDGIYYDTSKFSKYANFAQLDLDEQQSSDRVEPNPEKRNPSDFALWKFSPKDHQRDMEWDSPWGKGFPGWHIECSAMVKAYFGDTVDIHSGGIDHVPVHHTNEIAQSEAVTGKPLANIWMHTNHILLNDQKIAKSEGNGITLEDIEAKGYGLQDFRLLVLQSHYRTQSTFSWEVLQAASNSLSNLSAWADLRFQPFINPLPEEQVEAAKKTILGAMVDDDINSPAALAVLNGLVDEGRPSSELLSYIDSLLGTRFAESDDISESQKQLISDREQAREAGNWQKADELRKQLAEQGIEINDTEHGPIWYRT
ncbi:MAG TPA: cysteine--tRNA ligase [Candidatus Binatia bacterium]|nr:cysteine--tRNA ligase [Candidatus Binatia bacterium]